MLRSFKGQKKMQFKMKKIKPQMDEINEKMKSAKDEQERAQYSQEMMALYKEHGVNPLNMGCLPMIIQMPILMALYFAISHNDALASHSFAWFNLGSPNIFMALIAGALYLLQAYLSTKYLPEESNGQMKYIMYISPIMIFIVSMSTQQHCHYIGVQVQSYLSFNNIYLISTLIITKTIFKQVHNNKRRSILERLFMNKKKITFYSL